MEAKKPQKRHIALQPLSREHHQGLLLSWKIRKGLSKKIEFNRIQNYVEWFYENHLIQHFLEEETHVFPILGNDHQLVKRALSEHRRIKRLVEDKDKLEKSLHALEEELEKHIRFEERTLFNKIQEIANDEQLKKMEEVLTEDLFCLNWEDEFWK